MQNSTPNADREDNSELDSAEDYTPVTNDTDILEATGPGAASSSIEPELRHLQVGATAYSSDGQQVAVVETVRPGAVGVRAGQPGRSIEVPLGALAGVSQDGQRLDLRLSGEDVERLAGGDQPGYAHLAALRPQDVAEVQSETQPGNDAPAASR
jgi:hypothetical protein